MLLHGLSPLVPDSSLLGVDRHNHIQMTKVCAADFIDVWFMSVVNVIVFVSSPGAQVMIKFLLKKKRLGWISTNDLTLPCLQRLYTEKNRGRQWTDFLVG